MNLICISSLAVMIPFTSIRTELNPERHFKFNSCLHERLIWGLKDRGESRSDSRLKLVSDRLYRPSSFFGDFGTYRFKYVSETSRIANSLYFGDNERWFYSEFHSWVKSLSNYTWFWIDISFRIECSIRNEKWNELNPEWVATHFGFM